MNLYESHVAEWGACERCFLSQTRTNVCLARGTWPADVLFCGEAPGPSEDAIGEPFVGPAGQLLDHIVRQVLDDVDVRPSFCFSNLVACIPYDDDGDKFAEPPDECVEACKPRLIQLVELVRPRLIVCVGRLANDWLNTGYHHGHKLPLRDGRKITMVEIVHPAAILRAPEGVKTMMVRRCVTTLANAFEQLGG